jgi:tRNA pseudouridine55 synthase
VDKPLGLTSHAVVVTARRLSGQRKVGHAGTLDPMATGVLLVCLGKATRVSQYLMASPKAYRATVRLGISTTTHDAEGQITHQARVDVTREEVEAALRQFVGRVDQVPPAHSAIKHKGRRLYELARQGIPVQAPPRQVDVHRLHIVEWAPPSVHLDVECGPGTYVRALARDLGRALGCGAHLAGLRRTRSGQFTVERALSLGGLEEAFASATFADLLHPLDAALAHLPALCLDAEAARRLAMGQQVPDPGRGGGFAPGDERTLARAYAPGGQFVALAFREQETGSWRPRKVFVAPEDIPSAQGQSP